MSFGPHARSAPQPRAGRHLRHAGLRIGAAAAAVWLATAAMLAFAGPLAGAFALVGAVGVAVLGTCRLLAASAADAREERWLRSVLGGLQPYAGDEDDEGLVVF